MSLQLRSALFLTYPQASDASLDFVKATLMEKLSKYVDGKRVSDWDRGIIAREHHKDGEVHFHVFIHAKLCSQVQLVRIKHEDLELFGKRGNYQDARSDKAVVKYCTKEGDFIWWGQDPNVRSMLREGKAKLSLSSVVSGDMSLVDLVESDPRTLLHLDQLKKNLALFLSLKKTRIAKVPTLMYLFGPSGVGKTTLARSFAEEKEIYMVPMPPKAQTPFWFDGSAATNVWCSTMSARRFPLLTI